MAGALKCDICGGALVAKADGVFVCEYCGMKYDKSRVQQMVQEIHGTVSVEGTVEVTGKVQVEGGTVEVDMSARRENYLEIARQALNGNNLKEALSYANQVLEIDSSNGEAMYIKGYALIWTSSLANRQLLAGSECWKNYLFSLDEDKRERECTKLMNELKRAYSVLVGNEAGLLASAYSLDEVNQITQVILNIRYENIQALGNMVTTVPDIEGELPIAYLPLATLKNMATKMADNADRQIMIWKGSQELGSGAKDTLHAAVGLIGLLTLLSDEERLQAYTPLERMIDSLCNSLRKAQFNPGVSQYYAILRENKETFLQEQREKKALEMEQKSKAASWKEEQEVASTEIDDGQKAEAEELYNQLVAISEIDASKTSAKLTMASAEKKEISERLNKEISDLQGQLGQVSDLTDQKEKLLQTISTYEKELLTLGIFAGAKKKELKEKIESAKQNILQLEKLGTLSEELRETEKTYDEKIRSLKASLEEEEKRRGSSLTREEIIEKINNNPAIKTYIIKHKSVFTLSGDIQAQLGLKIIFGNYPQMANGEKKPIEWECVSREDNSILIISKLVLDCKPYDADSNGSKWENCSLRKWLNYDFLDMAFSTEERAKIQTANISVDKYSSCKTLPGQILKDKIFLLSAEEAEHYFSSDVLRSCEPTAYAVSKGIIMGGLEDSTNCTWWLRSIQPDDGENGAIDGVWDNGIICRGGWICYSNGVGVRPAMWINL